MKLGIHLSIAAWALTSLIATAEPRAMLIIVSEPGNPTYELEFQRQAEAWKSIASKGQMEVESIGLRDAPAEGDRPALEKLIAGLPKDGGDLWLVWIGHGSYDGRTANFNLRGPDIDAEAVKTLLEPFTRRLIILNLFSASGPFLTSLSGNDRVIVNATRGGENNYSRFGEKLADALTSPDADLDLDGSLSLLEAVLHASAAIKAFYEDAQRVVQEHSLIDDNGDGLGTPTESFEGFQADGESADGALAREIRFLHAHTDPLPPEAREERAKLELAITALRKRKPQLHEDDYYRRLEKLMRKMASLYEKTP